MWNSNSRRWLVTNKDITTIATPTTKANTLIINNNASASDPEVPMPTHCRITDCIDKSLSNRENITMWSQLTARRLSAGNNFTTTTTSAITTETILTPCTPEASSVAQWRSRSAATRVNSKACLNQIIEVLLAILLANCLMHLPPVLAVFGSPTLLRYELPSSSSIYNLKNNYDESNYNYNNNNNNNYNNNNNDGSYSSWLSQFNFRQPHSIASSNGAYSYNSLHETFDAGNQIPRSQNFKISPKPCSIGRVEGTCMFVWECIKSEGRHVGMCVDSFMFGSCCAHNYTDNIVLPQTFSYTRPTKPAGMNSQSGLNHRPRPPHMPHRPSISGMTTIERPHGAGTLVIRPSGPHHQGALHKPHKTSSTTTSTSTTSTSTSTTSTEDPHLQWTSNTVLGDMQAAASVSSPSAANIWHSSSLSPEGSSGYQQHWHMPTEPNFITKPRPPNWEKPTLLRPKPPKPTKKPILSILSERPIVQQTPSSSIVYSTRRPATTTTRRTITSRPKPQLPQYSKPMKVPTTTRPHGRPQPSWSTSESLPSATNANGLGSSFSATEKYKPTTTVASSSSNWSSYRPPIKTTNMPYSSSHGTSTKRPTMPSTAGSTHLESYTPSSSSLSISTSSASANNTTLSNSQSSPQKQHSSVESNEITGPSDSAIATIKTISAARSECGIPVLARPETRIVGGKSAAFGRWPWQVSVRRTSFFGFSSTHRCGGALINENWIATAGHCVDDLLISQIRIRVGEYDFSHIQEQLPYIERGVVKKVVHPKYNFFTYEYDLALVKLEQPLEFAPHVSPICLPQTDSLLIGMNATVTGWGRLSEGGTLPSVLQEVSVPIVSNDNCKSMFLRAGRQEFIPEIFLCAGYETGGQDSCQGDSGGPLQVKAEDGRFFLAGIISWGIGCAEANLPGVCTRISKFVPWILENVT